MVCPAIASRISKRDKITNILNDIIIYDHTENKGNNTVIMADKGRMFFEGIGHVLHMDLFDGEVFKQMETSKGEDVFWSESFDSAFSILVLNPLAWDRPMNNLLWDMSR